MINKNRDEEKQIEFDSMLDAALAKYAAVEPRTGLDERVLVNLRAEQARVPDNTWWRWSVATAVMAAMVVALALTWKSGKQSPIVLQHLPSTMTQTPKEPAKEIASNRTRDVSRSPGPARTRRTKVPGSQAKVVVAHNNLDSPELDQPKFDPPKLDQFPSPQPLSDQELALARYVSEFPRDATLIAQAQAEYEEEIRKKMNDGLFENERLDSDQQER
jgi:hypothetical protein